MRYNIISYLIGEGFKNISKNKKSAIASVTSMFLTMIMFGIFFIVGQNLNYIIKNIEQQQGMQVFVNNKDATDEEISELETKIREIQGVNTVKYVSKEDELNQIKEQWKSNETLDNLMDGFTEEQLQASFTVTLTDLELNESVQNQIKQLGDVEIVAGNSTINMLSAIARGVRIGTIAILIALIIISVLIISNTIKLTVHARRREISIMKYVGATNGFIRWPFIVEGIILGIVAALFTIIVIGLVYNSIAAKALQLTILQNLNISLVPFEDMLNLMLVIYLTLGIGIGAIGSTMSMKKYLEV